MRDVVGERTFGLASEQKMITMMTARHDSDRRELLQRGWKSILEEGVTPSEVVRPEAARLMMRDDDESASGTPATAPAEARPLSPEDAVYKKRLSC